MVCGVSKEVGEGCRYFRGCGVHALLYEEAFAQSGQHEIPRAVVSDSGQSDFCVVPSEEGAQVAVRVIQQVVCVSAFSLRKCVERCTHDVGRLRPGGSDPFPQDGQSMIAATAAQGGRNRYLPVSVEVGPSFCEILLALISKGLCRLKGRSKLGGAA